MAGYSVSITQNTIKLIDIIFTISVLFSLLVEVKDKYRINTKNNIFTSLLITSFGFNLIFFSLSIVLFNISDNLFILILINILFTKNI